MEQKAAQSKMRQDQKQPAVGRQRPAEQQAIGERGERSGRERDGNDDDVNVAARPHGGHDGDEQALHREQRQDRERQAEQHRYFTPPPMPRENTLKEASVPIAITTPFGRRRSVRSSRATQPPRTRLGSLRAMMRSRSPPPS